MALPRAWLVAARVLPVLLLRAQAARGNCCLVDPVSNTLRKQCPGFLFAVSSEGPGLLQSLLLLTRPSLAAGHKLDEYPVIRQILAKSLVDEFARLVPPPSRQLSPDEENKLSTFVAASKMR